MHASCRSANQCCLPVSTNMFLLFSFYESLPSSPFHFLHLMCFLIIYCIHVLVIAVVLFFFLFLLSFNHYMIYPTKPPNFLLTLVEISFLFLSTKLPPTSTLQLVRTSYPSSNMVFTPHPPHPNAVSNPHPRLVTLWFSLARD